MLFKHSYISERPSRFTSVTSTVYSCGANPHAHTCAHIVIRMSMSFKHYQCYLNISERRCRFTSVTSTVSSSGANPHARTSAHIVIRTCTGWERYRIISCTNIQGKNHSHVISAKKVRIMYKTGITTIFVSTTQQGDSALGASVRFVCALLLELFELRPWYLKVGWPWPWLGWDCRSKS